MKFIDKSLAPDENKVTNQNQVSNDNNIGSNSNVKVNNQSELEFNKVNRENFEKLMTESSTNLDGYYDKNNPFVKITLLILGVISVIGVVFYVLLYLNN